MYFLSLIPGCIGISLRHMFIPFKSIKTGVRIQHGTWFEYPEKLSLGSFVSINQRCYINAGGGIEVGNYVLIGPNVTIYSQNHNYKKKDMLIKDQDYDKKTIVIEDDVWLCANAIILPGVIIRKGSVVAAGAVVTKSTEPYSVVAGIPAVKVSERR